MELTTILPKHPGPDPVIRNTDTAPVAWTSRWAICAPTGACWANSSYEVNTPSAVITVRGTDFWSSGTWLSETSVNTAEGITEIKGVNMDGIIGPSTFIAANQSLYVRPDGQPGLPGLFTQPLEPPPAPLAPATCGNGTCDPGEEQVCALDCQSFPNCGNGVCELDALEGPVTCGRTAYRRCAWTTRNPPALSRD
jgi:hypothetical protein